VVWTNKHEMARSDEMWWREVSMKNKVISLKGGDSTTFKAADGVYALLQ